MDKQEILQRSQEENKKKGDERERSIVKTSVLPGYFVLGAIWLIFAFIERFFLNNDVSYFMFQVGACASLATQFLYVFMKTKKKLYLFMGIAWCIFAVVYLVGMLISFFVEQAPPVI